MVTIQFSEAVTDFNLDDLSAYGGQLSGLARQAEDRYTVVFTPNPGYSGAGNVVLSGAYADLAGNAGTGARAELLINTKGGVPSSVRTRARRSAAAIALTTLAAAAATTPSKQGPAATRSTVAPIATSWRAGPTTTPTSSMTLPIG